MSSSIAGLLALQERLISAELETKSGDKWFETWLELLTMEEQALPSELTDLAKRLDKILQVTVGSEGQLSAGAQAEKRSFEEVIAPETLESPPQKKAASEPVTHVEQTPKEAPKAVTQDASVQASAAEAVPRVIETQLEPVVPEQPTPPVSKLASFLQATEKPVVPTSPANGAGTPTAKSPPSPSSPTKAPSSPAAPKQSSSPSATSKPPSSPSAAVKPPSSPTVTAKPPSSPSLEAKPPSSPSNVNKTPSSPSATVKLASSALPRAQPATSKPPSSPPSSARAPENSAVVSGSPSPPATDSAPSQSPTLPASSSEGKPAPKQTEGGHMDVPDACFDMFQEVKIRKKHRFLIFKIQDWPLELVKVGERSLGLDDFMKELPFSECRFAVYDHEKLKSDQYGSRMAAKVYFVTWQPVPAPTQFKMLYSTERKTLSAVFKGVEEIVATKRDDILFAVGAKDKFAAEDSDDEERGGKGDWMDD